MDFEFLVWPTLDEKAACRKSILCQAIISHYSLNELVVFKNLLFQPSSEIMKHE